MASIRDHILYDERVFYDSESDKDKIHADGSGARYFSGTCRKCGAGRNDGLVS